MSIRLLKGCVMDQLKTLADDSVQCVVTSPPYWGLRDYKIPPSIWGGDPACVHAFDEEVIGTEVGKGNWAQGMNGQGRLEPGGCDAKREPIRGTAIRGFCRCGAWLGTLGLEPDYRLYIAHMVDVFRQVKRVLRKDGTLWLNLGDSYATGTGKERLPTQCGKHGYWENPNIDHRINGKANGLKAKDLCGIPWRVAFALQDDGWWLRQDIIWAKPNPMPESVTDRCTKSHEYLFLLAKSERYHYDAEAIMEEASASTHARLAQDVQNQIGTTRAVGKTNGNLKAVCHGYTPLEAAIRKTDSTNDSHVPGSTPHGGLHRAGTPREGRKPSGWNNSENYENQNPDYAPKREAEIARARKRMGGGNRSHKGVTEYEGSESEEHRTKAGLVDYARKMAAPDSGIKNNASMDAALAIMPLRRNKRSVWTITTQPFSEAHFATFPPDLVIPCILAGCPAGGLVLDPFGGAGTTGLVADRLGRNAVLIEINPDYAAMASKRITDDAPLFADVG